MSETDEIREKYKTDLAEFVDPGVPLDTDDQLNLMRRFNAEFGLVMPVLSEEQKSKIAGTLEENEGFRVVPTFLPKEVWQRRQQAERKESSPLREILRTNIVYTDEEDRDSQGVKEWAALWKERAGPVPVGEGFYDFRYKGPDGRILDRRQYLGALAAAGLGIKQEDGSVWTFPVMDVSDSLQREDKTVENIFKEVDPVIGPEARIIVQLIHVTKGQPKNLDVTEMVNEAVYRVKESGEDIGGEDSGLRGVVGVTWTGIHTPRDRIRMAWWTHTQMFADAQMPRGVSGL